MLDDTNNTPEKETPKEDVQTASNLATEASNNEVIETSSNNAEDTPSANKKETSKDVPMEDYDSFSMEGLTDALKNLINDEAVQKIKKNIDALKNSFDKKFTTFIEEKKSAFEAEGGNPIDFHFKSDLKYAFNGFINDYRKKVKHHYKTLEDQRNANYTIKTGIIEKIKALETNSEQSSLYSDFKKLRDEFFATGPIPREKNEDTWQNYRFHEQRIYDILHLNSDFRNLDFKHNLDKKTKIVSRAEELAKETDVNKAFKELQILHRMWKEEIGPVAREFREDIWDQFKAATKEINANRQEILDALEVKWEENVPKKEAVVASIKALVEENITSHNAWQNKIKEMQALRDEFFKIGKVPKAKSDIIWEELKQVTRLFNQHKNAFYKDVKNVHQENLDKKRALIDQAIALKDSEDLENTSNTLKKLQADWKTIGHVPRKFSDKMWNEFRGACNHFFDRLHANQDEANKELMVFFEEKKAYLDTLKASITEGTKVSIDDVKNHIQDWKKIGQVPQKMRFIESKFNKVIDKLFSKLDLDKKESAMLRFKNNMDTLIESNDTRKVENEAYFIRKKIDETTKEVKLLENNLGFFANASPDNPMVKNVYKNIEKLNEELSLWKQKMKHLSNIIQ
ncbi:MAG: DUF349 domain-containing protein [Flavobacteriaceae bacterium]